MRLPIIVSGAAFILFAALGAFSQTEAGGICPNFMENTGQGVTKHYACFVPSRVGVFGGGWAIVDNTGQGLQGTNKVLILTKGPVPLDVGVTDGFLNILLEEQIIDLFCAHLRYANQNGIVYSRIIDQFGLGANPCTPKKVFFPLVSRTLMPPSPISPDPGYWDTPGVGNTKTYNIIAKPGTTIIGGGFRIWDLGDQNLSGESVLFATQGQVTVSILDGFIQVVQDVDAIYPFCGNLRDARNAGHPYKIVINNAGIGPCPF